VLLVWDDIHAISPETGNTVFRKAIDELEDILSPDLDLYVLAAARSNHVESLPGNVQKTGSPLWSEFEIIELAEFGEEAIEALFDRVLAKEEVAVSEEVREAFPQKALETDPSPLYVISVVETADGERLTMDDIETLPEDTLAIWEDQYADIKAANNKQRFILWAVKLLSEVRVPYYHHSLLKGIYAHVLDRDELTFGPPVEELCQRQWLVPTDDEEEVTTYTVHDVKVEAINESTKGQLWSFSTFLFKEVERYLPSSESRTEHGLHENFGILLREYSIRRGNQLVSKHYEQALDLDPNCATAHINYANLLIEELDAPEKSKYHYDRALDIDPDNSKIHRTYAYFLKEELAALKEAEDHYERAIEISPDFAGARCDYANLLIEELDAPEEAKHHYERALDIDPDDIDVHNNYAKLLNEELAAPEEAKHHYEQALTTDPNHPQTHHNYADLLRTEFDMPEETNHHYERALDIDPDNARIHFCYAIHLNNDFNALEKAKHHYERALALNPDFAQAHVNYSILIHNEFDEPEEAKRHCERALAIDPDLPQAHHNYANFLRNELDAPENVRKHLEESVRCWHDVGNTENALHALYTLIQICRDVDDENTAIEYCKRAIDITDDADLDYELDLLWFESVHAVFSETNPRTLYEYSLANILENDLKLATELCEMVWTKRDEHSTESDIYQLALSAGIALAASTQLHDDLDVSHTCDEILNTIDPAQLPTPSVAVYNLLDTGTTSTTPDDLRARTTEAAEEMTVDALEPRAFAELLERLENE
jgi:tetratricopeptide (TPR) repeat protein